MMTDQRPMTPSGARKPLRRHLRSSSQSPSRQRRSGDDLLSRLSPATAVEALQSPTGALKQCLDQATVSERLFATRTAVASQKIYEWVDELGHWPWPAQGGSAGFEVPSAKRRKLSATDISTENPEGELADSSPRSDGLYCGSLPADDVALYEKRIDQIQEEVEALDLEEIKNQVLHNHILPLSRPGTPFSDAGLSVTSTMSFTRMEDLTAVVTALVMQTLPKLSRLSRLLNAWSIRLVLLPKVSALLRMLTDAEVALRSGWNVIQPADANSKRPAGVDEKGGDSDPTVTRKDFEVMKSVLHQKIQKPGQEIDYMLDALEGMQDTLPNEWLERLEAIEEDYARWEIAAEQQVREGEWLQARGKTRPGHILTLPQKLGPKIQIQEPSPAKDTFSTPPSTPVDRSLASEDTSNQDIAGDHYPAVQGEGPSEYGAVKILVDQPTNEAGRSGSVVIDLTEHAAHQRDIDSGAVAKNPSLDYDGNNSGPSGAAAAVNEDLAQSDSDLSLPSPEHSSTRFYDGSRDLGADANIQDKSVLSELSRNVVRASPAQSSKTNANAQRSTAHREPESSIILESDDEWENEDDELLLPPIIQRARRGSEISMASTVLHGSTSHFFDPSDDAPFRGGSADLELPRLPDPDEPFSSDALSPPSSPPLRYKARSTSVTFKENPEVAPMPRGSSSPPISPLEPSPVFDPDVSYELESQLGSPCRMSRTNDKDRRLQRQIGAILESVPLKIRLNSKASAINLNPPDFQPPRPRPRTPDARRTSESRRRSVSSVSSRAATPSTFSRSGTPSYMLAPARGAGPRSKSSQEIKVYHLLRAGSEAPIKLFIRTVGERNERVMVRVGGGWSDLGEYLREYALHHGRRSKGEGKVEVTDLPSATSGHVGSSPSERPSSAMDTPMTPLRVRKTRKSLGEESLPKLPRTPLPFANKQAGETPNSESSAISRDSAKADWDEESSSLGLAGPKPKKVEISEESRAWVESVKEKVRMASGDRTIPDIRSDGKFGEIGKVGGTKRLYRKN